MEARSRLITAFLERHPTDAAVTLEKRSPRDAGGYLSSVPAQVAAGVVARFSPFFAANCLEAMNQEHAANLLLALPSKADARMLRFLDKEVRKTLLEMLPQERRQEVSKFFRYAENTLGSLSDPQVTVLASRLTAGEAVRQMREGTQALSPWVYLVDQDRKLQGVVAAHRLFEASPDSPLKSLARAKLVRLPARTPAPVAANHEAWADFDELPVVDWDDAFLGVVRWRSLRSKSERLAAGSPASEDGLRVYLDFGEALWLGFADIVQSLSKRTGPQTGGGSNA